MPEQTTKPQGFQFSAPVKFVAASGEGKLPSFSMVAYTGAAMSVGGFGDRIVLDMAGIRFGDGRIPIRLQHDALLGVGHTTAVRVEGGQLVAEGVISRGTEAAREVVQSGKSGFPWQASIGATALVSRFIRPGVTATVNGREFTGPLRVIEQSELSEISFVDRGADSATSAAIAAKADTITEPNDMSKQDENGVTVTADATKTTPDPKADPVITASATSDYEAEMAALAIRDEEDRKRGDLFINAARANPGIAASLQPMMKLASEERWPVSRVELEINRERGRHGARGPRSDSPDGPTVTGKVLEAAMCLSGGMPEDDVLAGYGEQSLDQARKQYGHGVGLVEVLQASADRNGYARISARDTSALIRAAFEGQRSSSRDKLDIRAAAGSATFDISGILSNVANKFIRRGFDSVEAFWRDIAAIRPVRDFKLVSTYSLTGGFKFEQLAPGGELKSATIGSETYNNQADTYGIKFGIDRRDIINDDLGALTDVPMRIGRGGALKFNEVFWLAFLADNNSFYTSGRGNYFEGSTSALGIDSLTTAERLFFDQKDPDDNPLGLMPELLVVPNALNALADNIMRGPDTRNTTANTKDVTRNPHQGKFRVVRSSYLNTTAIAGGSGTAWWLLANPASLPVIEAAFLNGNQSPTVDQAQARFDTLGIDMRGYFDFGVRKQEYRAGVKSKGAA